MQCPQCQSDDTTRAEVIYNQGTNDVRLKTRGLLVGITGFSLGALFSRSSGTQQSRLASQCSPPMKKRTLVAGILFFVGVVAAGILLTMITLSVRTDLKSIVDLINLLTFPVAIGGGIALMVRNIWFNVRTWPRLHSQWLRSWVCLRCGAGFQVE